MLTTEPENNDGQYALWKPKCDFIRLIRFGDRLDALDDSRFSMAVIRPTTRFPLDGSSADAMLWLSIIFQADGWNFDANTKTRINWLPVGADFRLWGFEAVAAFFRISVIRALNLFDRTSYAQADWQNKSRIVNAVRGFAVNEATAPHRRSNKSLLVGSRFPVVLACGRLPKKRSAAFLRDSQ